jgi:hypothetical protein
MVKQEIFNEAINEYRSLISETPLYKGLEQVLDSEELKQLVENRYQEIETEYKEEGYDDFEECSSGTIYDSVDIFVMQLFAKQFIQNLINEGFTWDKKNECWDVPEKTQTKFANITGKRSQLTNYGIIWDVTPKDYDTCIREAVSSQIDDAMVEMKMM